MTFDKNILSSYLTEHYITRGYADSLRFDYVFDFLNFKERAKLYKINEDGTETQIQIDPFQVKTSMSNALVGKSVFPLINRVNLEDYDKMVEYIIEFGRLIDSYYKNYSKSDKKQVYELYEFYKRGLFREVTKDLVAFTIENKEIGDHYKIFFDTDIDKLCNVEYWNRICTPCHCYTFSMTKHFLEKNKIPTAAENFWGIVKIASKKIGGDLESMVMAIEDYQHNLRLTLVFDFLRRHPGILDIIQDLENSLGERFMNSMIAYLTELRQEIDLSMDTLELGKELYNQLIAETVTREIQTPMEFVEKVNNCDLIEEISKHEENIPESFAKIYNLIFTENYE